MIDRPARTQLAERLRHLAAGQMTNDAFEAAAAPTRDRAVPEIEHRLAWPCYDGFKEHRLRGEHALTDGARRDFARAILFLKTDLEYEWRHWRGLRGWVNSCFRLLPWLRVPPLAIDSGDLRYWPFYRRSDYFAARESPVYLNGMRQAP
jgi:hypothetical protein